MTAPLFSGLDGKPPTDSIRANCSGSRLLFNSPGSLRRPSARESGRTSRTTSTHEILFSWVKSKPSSPIPTYFSTTLAEEGRSGRGPARPSSLARSGRPSSTSRWESRGKSPSWSVRPGSRSPSVAFGSKLLRRHRFEPGVSTARYHSRAGDDRGRGSDLRDPFDALICAAALSLGLPLLTRDQTIEE